MQNQRLPYLTADLEGCGGRLKSRPEDFSVEEIPLYEPSGQGEHLYLWIEKKDLPTEGALRHLCRQLEIRPEKAGHAGKKDSRSIARQWLSFHTPHTPSPGQLETGSLRVLRITRHINKLRRGHLRGNRFDILLRGISSAGDPQPILRRIRAEGFPNYFGQQRLGEGLANALAGRDFVRKSEKPSGSLERIRFATNAYQALLFNEVTARRLGECGNLGRMLTGDLAVLHANGACFDVAAEELDEQQARAALWELSPSAPLFGYRVPLAQGQPGCWERELLALEGLQPQDFRLGGKRVSPKGERRAVRAFPENLHWEPGHEGDTPTLKLGFTLGKGVYATSLLREVMKNDGLSSYALQPS